MFIYHWSMESCNFTYIISLIKYQFIDHLKSESCNLKYNKYKCDYKGKLFYNNSLIDKDSFCNNCKA
ncbi:hypothetical protein HZS_4648 [Henneguya salminicola]|nr:hypothetical protein HZS_4648 [Henneguya salminicola]